MEKHSWKEEEEVEEEEEVREEEGDKEENIQVIEEGVIMAEMNVERYFLQDPPATGTQKKVEIKKLDRKVHHKCHKDGF